MRLADSNILLYAISSDPEEADKRARAIELLGDDSLALSVQVLQEFYYQATRQSRPNRLSHDEAMRFIDRLAEVPVQPVTTEVFRKATQLCHRFGISYWDAAILAAAATLQCEGVYSEDMNHQQDYDGMRVINPFVQ
jgi:predicted nucleic acid-binding protein